MSTNEIQKTRSDKIREELINLCGAKPSSVYINPPSVMEYPCYKIVKNTIETNHAGNSIYLKHPKYKLYYITPDPDDPKNDVILENLKYVSAERSYLSDGLYHNVYTIY